MHRGSITGASRDGNPGTANAFLYGGFWCGMATLCCDLLKGFLPVFFYLNGAQDAPVQGWVLSLVIAAPVIGHILPAYSHFKGGKGIATTFGCLLGLMPNLYPVGILVVCFLFFSCVLRITPHYYRTLFTYISAVLILFPVLGVCPELGGFLIISLAVTTRLRTSREIIGDLRVRLLWMH